MKVPKLVALLLTATLLTAMVMPFLGGPGQRAVPRTGLEEEVKSVEPTPAVEPASEAPPRESLDTVDDDPARVVGETPVDLFEDARPAPGLLPPAENPFQYRHADASDFDLQRATGQPLDVTALLARRAAAIGAPWTASGLPAPPALAPGDAARPLNPFFAPGDFIDVAALRAADPSGQRGNNNDDSPPDWDAGKAPKSVGMGTTAEMPRPYKGKPYEKLAYHLCSPGAVGDFKNFQWDVYDPIIRDQGRFDDALGTFTFVPDGESDSLSYFGEPLFPGADNPDGLVFFLRWRDSDCDGVPNHFDLRWPFAEFWGDRGNGKVTFAYQFPFDDFFENRDNDLLRDSSHFEMQIGFWEDGEPLFYPPFLAPDTDSRAELINLQSNFQEDFDDRNGDGVLDVDHDRYARYWDVGLELDGPLGENNGITEGAFFDIATTEFEKGAIVEDWRVVLYLDHGDDGKGPLTNVLAGTNQVDEHYWLDNVGGVLFHAPPEDFTDGFGREPNFRKLPYHLSDRMDSMGPKAKDFSGIPPPPVSPIPTPPVALSAGLGACGGGAVDRGFPAKYAEGAYQGLYLLLLEILDAGLPVPPQLVPYWVYTLSDGVEKFCQAITNVAATLNLDDDDATGKGLLGDMRLNSHLELGPLAAVSKADLLGDVNPSSLTLNITFPAFFFNGEAHDIDGEPHWKYGYITQPAEPIPRDLVMTLAVDHTVGAEHVFDFDWDSINGIPPLGFQFGVFQVVAQDLSDPRLEATGDFTVSSPPFAFLTFTTMNTLTTTTNCMNWNAPSDFLLSFGFNGNRTILGVDVIYQINLTVQNVPQSWSLCWIQDRAAFTDTFTYAASADVALVDLVMALNISGITNLTLELEILGLPTGWSATVGDGFLDFLVTPSGDTIDSLRLDITETTGFLAIQNAIFGQTIVFFHLLMTGIPSFNADWFTGTATPAWNFFRVVTVAPLDLDTLTVAFSTAVGTFATLPGVEGERALLYHNDSLDLGNGFVMEGSFWARFRDLTRAEVGFGGAIPTIAAGIETAAGHALRVGVQLANESVLNPLDPPGPLADANLTAVVFTTPLPLSMDFNLTPRTNFTYAASGEIDQITGDLATDEATVHVEIEGIPASADGRWDTDEDGFVTIHLADRLDRIEAILERPDRLFTTDFRHVELLVLDIPEDFTATWDTPNRTARVSFLDGDYDEGLGELAFLGTTGRETNTTAYMNSLGIDGSCMVAYSAYTQAIDAGYWPANNVTGRLNALHCRHPTLDTVLDDYAVQGEVTNSTDDFEVTAFRVREIGFAEVNWTAIDGFLHLEFSRNVVLGRSFIYIADDLDDDAITVVEVSNLPDGNPSNFAHAEWDFNLTGAERNRVNYTLSEVIPFIDYYAGVHNRANLSAALRKVVLQNVPADVVLEWLFGALTGPPPHRGSLDFTASDPWEVGFLEQSGGKRYAAWLALQSFHFDYDIALPGEEACSVPVVFSVFDWCYRIFRVDTAFLAVDSVMDAILGIYTLEDGLDNLDSGEVASGDEYIPEWGFMMDDFESITINAIWDVGIGVSGLSFILGIPVVELALLPDIDITLEVGTLVADYFWNDQVSEDPPPLGPFPGLPPPLGCGTSIWDVSLKVNTVKDYVNQVPIHLVPITVGSLSDGIDTSASSFSIDFTTTPLCIVPVDAYSFDIVIDIPGFHGFGSHPTLFP